MKKLFYYVLLGGIIILSYSCGERNPAAAIDETPKALKEEASDVKRYSSYDGDLTETLYQELVDKSPGLQKLEEDVKAFSRKPDELKEKFRNYDNKSETYYSSANRKAATITDSLLRKRIESMIENSKTRYATATAELNSLLKLISKNGTTLQDHHEVLKIVLTLPVVEKYQGEKFPDKKEFNNLIREQEKLIKRVDSLAPGYKP